MVIVHGYGGSNMIFYKIFKYLSEKFHVIAFDIIGMGASSRPKFKIKEPAEAEDFLVESVE